MMAEINSYILGKSLTFKMFFAKRFCPCPLLSIMGVTIANFPKFHHPLRFINTPP